MIGGGAFNTIQMGQDLGQPL